MRQHGRLNVLMRLARLIGKVLNSPNPHRLVSLSKPEGYKAETQYAHSQKYNSDFTHATSI